MEHIIPCVVVIALGLTIAVNQQGDLDRNEARLGLLSYLGHVISAIVQVWIVENVYGSGDMFLYFREGSQLSDALSANFSTFAPEVLKLIFQQSEPMIPADIDGVGNSTGSMAGIAAFLIYSFGGSVYAVALFIATGAYLGKMALYRVYRETFESKFRERVGFATLLLPSVLFWSSSILKESIAIGFLGWMVRGVHRALNGRLVVGAVMVASAGVFVMLVKPYILMAFVLAAGAWVFLHRRRDQQGEVSFRLRPVQIFFSLVLVVGGLVVIGQIFPNLALDNVAEETARLQELGQTVRGGSNYSIGDPKDTTLLGQLSFAPMALVSAWFRPFFFEVRSVLVGLAALESTAITFMVVNMFRRKSPAALLRTLLNSPVLAFCFVFSLVFGVGVGLATTNLGSLSRYRMPLLPFFAPLVFLMSSPAFGRARKAALPGGAASTTRVRLPNAAGSLPAPVPGE